MICVDRAEMYSTYETYGNYDDWSDLSLGLDQMLSWIYRDWLKILYVNYYIYNIVNTRRELNDS